jgi:LPS O-antigen subunit length determinant protein (WzzB/FepE family)
MENSKTFDTVDLFVWIWKKRLPIIVVTAAAAVISVIVSLLLPDYYKSQTVLLPTTFISPATGILHINTNQETDPMIIGNEDDTEKMIQILKSDFIFNKIVQKYDLIKHYGISEEDPHLQTVLKKTYEGNVTFSKTPYQGVVISVTDIDPILASNMSNDIAHLFDTLVYNMQKQRLRESYNISKKAYFVEKEYVEKLEDSLDIYRQYGILDYYKEVERYSEAYGKAVGNNTLTGKGQKFFDEKFELFKKYGQEFYSLVSQVNALRKNVAQLHLNMVQAKQNLEQPFTHKYISSYAQPSDKKAFPKRSLIVIFATFGGFMFVIALLLFFDFFKELKIRIKQDK